MFKRTWIVIMGVIGAVGLLSGCVGGKLAKDLTPIPTLPPGEQPALVDALQVSTASPAPAAGGAATSQDQLVATGEQLFSGTCTACHGDKDGAGPAFVGMADRAATRVDGMTAEDYLHESIVDPSAYVVEGFSDIMPKQFADQFSAQEIDALVAYIMADSSGTAAPVETPAPTTEPATPEAPAATETPVESTQAAAAPTGNADNGATIFASSCSACHGAQDGAGPAVTGIAERAATRVDGMTAADYLHESIVDPSAYVVEGFADIMPKTFAQQFSDQEINDLVAYLLTQ